MAFTSPGPILYTPPTGAKRISAPSKGVKTSSDKARAVGLRGAIRRPLTSRRTKELLLKR